MCVSHICSETCTVCLMQTTYRPDVCKYLSIFLKTCRYYCMLVCQHGEKMVKKKAPPKKIKKNLKPSSKIGRTPSMRSLANLHLDKENAEQRQQGLQNQYVELDKVAKICHQNLEDAIKFFCINNKCNDFEQWMAGTSTLLLSFFHHRE